MDGDSLVQPCPQLSCANVTCAKAEAADYGCAEDGDPGRFMPV